ncbi:MAG: RdgB/HAM1 family non-canonical purine NTP pyrophosphatase [Sphingobacteriales bacterium]|nr:MAG: RdgB/HAM1 family non-canonical purine NTP pyrophosphatase [Sphingobacteriales bacterium]
MEIVFATNNQHKIDEIQLVIPQDIKLKNLISIGCNQELPETHHTLEENAVEKATFVTTYYNIDCFAEDTGLEVEALNGEPGVISARYAGTHRSNEDNISLLLKNMAGIENRKARFRTVIALLMNGNQYLFEGILEGTIALQTHGDEGFGYDPVFRLADGRTLAELSKKEKGEISHRGIATRKLVAFLSKNQ